MAKNRFGFFPILVTGWILGYLKVPYLSDLNDFTLGVSLCCSLLGFIWVMRSVSKIKRNPSQTAGSKSELLKLSISAAILFVSLIGVSWVKMDNTRLHGEVDSLKSDIESYSLDYDKANLESARAQLPIVITDLKIELEDSLPGVSSRLIIRLRNLVSNFEPIQNGKTNADSSASFSPDRGHLLIQLLGMNMDTLSWSMIKREVDFSKSDLRGASLSGINLAHINLSGSNFTEANLEQANFHNAHLAWSNFSRANVSNAEFSGADLSHASLEWATAYQTSFVGVNLNGARIENVQARKSNFDFAKIQWASCNNSDFRESQVRNCDFTGSDLSQANFNNCNLSKSVLTRSKLEFASLIEANLSEIQVKDEQWIAKLGKLGVTGSDEVAEDYSIVPDSVSENRYRIIQNR